MARINTNARNNAAINDMVEQEATEVRENKRSANAIPFMNRGSSRSRGNNNNTNQNNQRGSNEERKPTEFYVNTGKYVVDVDEQGNEFETFYSLPLGAALDIMQPVQGDSDFAKRKNRILNAVWAKAKALEPGESVTVNLDVVITRADLEKRNRVNTDVEDVIAAQLDDI